MMIEVKNLSQKFGDKVAVDNLNLMIEKGSLTALLGPNGAGKSTTMRMLTKMTKPSSGQIIYEPNVKIGVVFQSSVLDDELTVLENLKIRAKQYKSVSEQQINSLVHDLGLTEFKNQRYQTLSGGQKRRVDIARALLNQPDILFLDEPTTGLDIQTRRAIWELLHHLQEEKQLTIVLTTHYLDEADHADMVYIIDHGHLIAKGSAQAIKERYAENQLLFYANGLDELKNKVEVATKLIETRNIQQESDYLKIRGLNLHQVIALINQFEQDITNFEYKIGTMDDAFVNLTGKEMR